MTLPTTTVSNPPFQGDVLVKGGNRLTQPWTHFFQFVYSRIGGSEAPTNLEIANALSSTVTGPSGAVDSDIAIFSGPTGYVIKDSGTKISSLAPLLSPPFTGTPTAPTAAAATNTTQIATTAFVEGEITPLAPKASPTFTGTPLAPTATAGTNTTQIATTAFVTTAVAKAGLTSSNFSAHNNGTNQSIPTGAFTTVTVGTTLFNNGSNFTSNAWTPPSGRPILLSGAVQMNITGSGTALLAIFKNGAEFKRGTQQNFSGLVTAGVSVTVSIVDIPNGTDVYTLSVFQNTGSAMNTVGTASLVWFQGTSIQA